MTIENLNTRAEIEALLGHLQERRLSQMESAFILASGVAAFVKTAAGDDEAALEDYLAKMNATIRQAAGLPARGSHH